MSESQPSMMDRFVQSKVLLVGDLTQNGLWGNLYNRDLITDCSVEESEYLLAGVPFTTASTRLEQNALLRSVEYQVASSTAILACSRAHDASILVVMS